MSTLSFKTYTQAEVVKDNQVILFHENGDRQLLNGKLYASIAPYLSQGLYLRDEIVDQLSNIASAAEVYYALARLEEKGFLELNRTQLPSSIRTLCNTLNVCLEKAEKRLQKTVVTIHSESDSMHSAMEESLHQLGISVGDEGHLFIILTDNYLKHESQDFTTPTLFIRPNRSEIWVGPLLGKEQGACPFCLFRGIKENSFEELYVHYHEKRHINWNQDLVPSMSLMAYHIAAQEIFRWIVEGKNEKITQNLLTYKFASNEISAHPILKWPNCAKCQPRGKTSPKKLTLESQQKHYTTDGGHRTISPDETYEKYSHLISPITGVVHDINPTKESSEKWINVFRSAHNFIGLHFHRIAPLAKVRSRSAGKGKTIIQGKVSCLCEAIERYSGIFQGNEQKMKARYVDIARDAIDPRTIEHYSDFQYANREKWNRGCHVFHYVTESFDRKQELEWSKVWSLSEDRFKYIPTGLCYYKYPYKKSERQPYMSHSNGNAAGNTLEEAILQGFFELIERDSIALWWYSRVQRPSVDLTSFDDPYLSEMDKIYRRDNRNLWVIDLTWDLKIPTMAAVSCNKNAGELLLGFGSHFDPKIALSRSLSELNQFYGMTQSDPTRSTAHLREAVIDDWLKHAQLKDHPYFIPSSSMSPTKQKDYERFDTPDIKDDILACQKIVEAKGMEMLVLDQTRPHIGLPVVKVFVPGLRHFWNRYAPGRLYDIPYEMGFVNEKLTEQELNPTPFFL